MEDIQTVTIGKKTLRIVTDEDSESPRAWDNLGKMVCFHREYNIGDKHDFTVDSFNEFIKRKDIVKLPIFLYDHSGLWIKTSKFIEDSAGWDTSFIGYIYVEHDKIKKEYGKVTKKTIEKAIDVLENEVKTYNDFISGNVYGYIIEKAVKCDKCNHVSFEIIDSCFGFIGNIKDSGILDNIPKQFIKKMDII